MYGTKKSACISPCFEIRVSHWPNIFLKNYQPVILPKREKQNKNYFSWLSVQAWQRHFTQLEMTNQIRCTNSWRFQGVLQRIQIPASHGSRYFIYARSLAPTRKWQWPDSGLLFWCYIWHGDMVGAECIVVFKLKIISCNFENIHI